MDPVAIHTTHTHVCKVLFDTVGRLFAAVLRELEGKELQKTGVKRCSASWKPHSNQLCHRRTILQECHTHTSAQSSWTAFKISEFLPECEVVMWKPTIFPDTQFSHSSISWQHRLMIVHTTIIDHVCLLSDVIACAQWQLIALHGGDRRLTHFSYPPQTLISPLSHKYTEEFNSHNNIMVCVGHRLHEYIVCMWFSCCMMKNEELKVRAFGADFRPKSMFSHANTPVMHCNWSVTSVNRASHHHTCSL